MANICHEYIEFGVEAFVNENNKFKQICIKHDGNLLIVRPIFKDIVEDTSLGNQQLEEEMRSSQQLLLLCFICDVNCKIGQICLKIKTLADNLAEKLHKFNLQLYTNDENNQNEQVMAQNAPGYDPMKDPSKVNVVY